jgi:CBS domain-containing protein
MPAHSATPEPWDRPLREFPGLVHLAPPVSHPDDSLTRVVETFARDSGAGGVFVVDADERLLGCIREHMLDSDLVTLVLPQRLWSSVRDFDTRQVLRAARPTARRAKDLMTPTRSVTAETSLKDALALMTRAEEPAAALVDGAGRFLGYVRRFEVLAHFVRHST